MESLNGERSRRNSSGKRKHTGSISTIDRPTKHLREEDNFSDDGSEVDMMPPDASITSFEEMTLGMEPERLLPTAALADSAEWQRTIESVVRNVVSIRFCQTCSFDTDSAITSEATGFVVDAEKGYILTNRHVVCAGPFWGYCVFDNHEEVSF
jgi:S1-C subfamily serine protease